jgi:hypothetical protein
MLILSFRWHLIHTLT